MAEPRERRRDEEEFRAVDAIREATATLVRAEMLVGSGTRSGDAVRGEELTGLGARLVRSRVVGMRRDRAGR